MQIDRYFQDLLQAQAHAVVMEIESGRNAHRVVEEAAVVGDGRLVVDLLGGCVKGAAGIESGAIDVPEGEHVLADVEFVEQTDTPAAYRQGEAPAFGRFPALFGAAVALQALQVAQPGIEGVGSFVAVADVGIEQDVVHDPFVQLRIVGFGVVEQGHDIAAVPVASLVFAAREDAELLARLVRAHSLPVEGELDEGARLGFIVGGQALDAIIIERVGTAQEERIVSGQQQRARENTGYGLCRLRVELVVDLGVHFTQELVFLVAEVLQQIDGYHQLVFSDQITPAFGVRRILKNVCESSMLQSECSRLSNQVSKSAPMKTSWAEAPAAASRSVRISAICFIGDRSRLSRVPSGCRSAGRSRLRNGTLLRVFRSPKLAKIFGFAYFCRENREVVTMRKITNEELGRPSAEEFARMEKMPVAVVLDNVRSMQNVGAFFRTADAFAVERIALCGITATPPNREIHKTALGAELTVAWDYFAATTDCIAALRAQGYLIYVVEQVEGAVMLDEFRPRPGQKYALVFGNEVDGVAQEVVDAADGAIEIPQAGTKHSVNVSVAGGVVLWNFFWQVRPKR